MLVLCPCPHACLHTYTQTMNKWNLCFEVGIVIYLYLQCKANETIYYNVYTQNLLLGSVPVQRIMCSYPILSWNSQRRCTFFFAMLRKEKFAFRQVLFLPSLCPWERTICPCWGVFWQGYLLTWTSPMISGLRCFHGVSRKKLHLGPCVYCSLAPTSHPPGSQRCRIRGLEDSVIIPRYAVCQLWTCAVMWSQPAFVLRWTKWRNSSTLRAPRTVCTPSITLLLAVPLWLMTSGATSRWMPPPSSSCSWPRWQPQVSHGHSSDISESKGGNCPFVLG